MSSAFEIVYNDYITEFSNVWKFIAENLKDLDNIIG